MGGSIPRILATFKQSWSRTLEDDAILAACREAGHRWRERDLGPAVTVKMFLLQILFGNAPCHFVPHLADKDVTGSAYCTARGRLPLTALQSLLTRSTTKMVEAVGDVGLWLGHRLFLIDGSSFSRPDVDELRDPFGQSAQQTLGCGFPTAHWTALVHFGSGLFQKVLPAPLATHDLSEAPKLHPEFQAGDVLVGDRAFGTYAHVALLMCRGVHAVMRAHQRRRVDFTPDRPHAVPGRGAQAAKKGRPRSQVIQRLGAQDQIVEWLRPTDVPLGMSAEEFAALPAARRVRELRYAVARPGYRVKHVTLVATLLDAKRYSAAQLAEA